MTGEIAECGLQCPNLPTDGVKLDWRLKSKDSTHSWGDKDLLEMEYSSGSAWISAHKSAPPQRGRHRTPKMLDLAGWTSQPLPESSTWTEHEVEQA